eukprot:jgi/Chlat1/6791/Chrsp51S06488
MSAAVAGGDETLRTYQKQYRPAAAAADELNYPPLNGSADYLGERNGAAGAGRRGDRSSGDGNWLNAMFSRALKNSYTLASVDLLRRPPARRIAVQPDDVASPPPYEPVQSRPWWVRQSDVPKFREGTYGTRFKLMRIWEGARASDEDLGVGQYPVNFGIGASISVETGQLDPVVRLKARWATLRFLPTPTLELRQAYRLTKNLAIGMKYRLPVSDLDQGVFAPARLHVALFNPVGSGIHLTPSGLEFDERIFRLGPGSHLRLGATVDLPREFPLEPGERVWNIAIHRAQLKARLA